MKEQIRAPLLGRQFVAGAILGLIANAIHLGPF